MRRLEDLLAHRDEVAGEYGRRLEPVECVSPIGIVPTTTRMSWFVYAVRFDEGIDRNKVLEAMARRGIPTRPYFTPIHLQPFYRKKFGFKPGDFPEAEKAGASILALPFYGLMKPEEVQVVCENLADVVKSTDNS
jgi:perosamine synthetase